LSTFSPSRLSRKKRYAIALIVAIIGITIAFYNQEKSAPYQSTKEWNFDSYQNNTVPNGFAYLQTDDKPGLWIVKADPSAPSAPNVLAKLPDNDTKFQYHIQLMPDAVETSNSEVSVKFKIVSGQEAQAVGLVIRLIDNDHYYVLLADAMNNRFSVCRAEPGTLLCILDKKAAISTNEWHTITAGTSDQGIAGSLDNKLLIRLNDQHYQTGQQGLWTKKDTEAYFDDLKIKY
jgi:hypothetical protein